MRLVVQNGGASPGRLRDIKVQILHQDIDVISVRFDYLYDESNLFVTEVLQDMSGDVFRSISVDSLTGGLRIYLHNAEPFLPQGHNYIAKIVTLVGEHVPRRSEFDLALINIVLTDTLGNEILLPDHNRTFTVPEYDFYLDFGTSPYWGAPGYTEIKTWLYVRTSYVEATAIDFRLFFNTDVFSVNRVEQTESSKIFSNFHWNSIADEIHISMSDSVSYLPETWRNWIAFIYFDIATDAPESVYYLLFDNIIILDTTGTAVPTIGTDKEFTIGWPTLKVTDGQGFPGSSRNLVHLNLDSGFETSAMQANILFDTSVLSVSHMERTERSQHMSTFHWYPNSEGILFVSGDIGIEITEGTGPISNVYVNVKEGTAWGEYPMRLSEVNIEPCCREAVDHVYLIDGTFHVIPQPGDVNGDGVLSVEDVIAVVNIMLGFFQPSSYQLMATDLNKDGVINVLDAVSLVNILLEP